MRKLAGVLLLTLAASLPLTAEAAPSALLPQRTFDETACPRQNQGDAVPTEGELSYSLMDIASVHEYSTGRNVRIGILDSGVNGAHLTLEGASLEAGVDLTAAADGTTDTYGSGTTYSSILVGRAGDQPTVRGIAPNATIVPIKIIDVIPDEVTPEYSAALIQRLTDGINWAVDNDLDLVVTALAVPQGTDGLAAAVERAAQSGVLVIAPVGELSGQDEEPESKEEARRYPAAYPSVLAVTAVDQEGIVIPASLSSDAVDVAGPGQNVPAANNAAASATCVVGQRNPSSVYASFNVAGVAALLMSAHPDERPDTIVHRLETTAIRPDPDRPGVTGWGVIDPAGALHFIDDGTAHGPDSPQHERPESEEVQGRAPLLPEPDAQRFTKPVVYLGLAGGVAVALSLVLFAAGLSRRPRR